MTAGSHKKYLFDNDFGLDDGLHTRHRGPKTSETDIKPNENPVETEAVTIETVEAPPPPPPPTYSQEDLDRVREEGRQAGRDEATRDMASALEQRLVNTLDAIDTQIAALFNAYAQDKNDRSRDAIGVATIIVRKLFPSINMGNAMVEIEHMIIEAMQRTSGNPSLIVRISKDMHLEVQAKTKELAALRGRENAINVIADDTLGLGDAVVEWEGGGMIRDTQFIWQEIDGIIERNLGQKVGDSPLPTDEKKPALEPKLKQFVVNPTQVGENEQNTVESPETNGDAAAGQALNTANDEPTN